MRARRTCACDRHRPQSPAHAADGAQDRGLGERDRRPVRQRACGRDLSRGGGAHRPAFWRTHPAPRATIPDFPERIDRARRYAAEAGLGDRIAHLPGNAISTPWPQAQDVVLMSYVWSAVGAEDVRILSRRAFEALKPGGLVLIHDFMVDDRHEGPAFAAWYLLASIPDNPHAACP